ncbi:CAP domain-containing protein [Lachnospiraceae bacterium 46-61]
MNISDLDAFIKNIKDTYIIANYYGIDKLYDRDDIEYIHMNTMIKLYHVIVDYNNEPDYKLFQPRIPKSAPKMEGIFTKQPCKRVCFSDSIESCINAIKQRVLSIRNDNTIKVYEIEIPVDDDEVKRLQREHGYNTNTTNDENDYKESTSSKKERDYDIYCEYNGKIYYSEEEWREAERKAGEEATEKAREEEQWEIEHYAEGTLELVNEVRTEEGLPTLTLDPDLVEAAEIHARELCELYSHTRPDGRRGSIIIDDLNIPYTISAENIAKVLQLQLIYKLG